MAEEKQAKKVYTLEEIKFNEANKIMAILACFPLIGLILFFVEKEDKFVRYIGAQFVILGVVSMFIGIIPLIGWLLAGPVMWVLIIIGMVKASKGERFDIPVVSEWALKLMGSL
ncbi:MAG: hypothetical protein XD87_0273 [candidate division WS6 bacterium 36_33]|uniref:Uncharacterized protein n=1 Tax=candidate division WS6 bacterium 36_33 TaxID=1641388 RepID=A0A101GYT4_9BACT|nr:MAG: hypothetical protein XD87_0273 [candidate division WS6 bacterium 36_33]